MNTYERIARVVRYLDAHHADQPDLAALARHVGLSRHHFHRLFVSWARITPKDFLQCLTLAHAKKLLQGGKSVLHAALETGLSSPGRLYDLCVTLEAASPGEMKSGGEGWTISFGFAGSPFGNCLIGKNPRGLCHVSFVEPNREKSALTNLQTRWPQAHWHRDDALAGKLAGRIFYRGTNKNSQAPLRAFMRGTSFQVRVWRALLQVEPGTVISYGRLATVLQQPSASRAVRSAVGKNPLARLIPCHRVIRETGVLGNYRWG